jgi:hypothetical protein
MWSELRASAESNLFGGHVQLLHMKSRAQQRRQVFRRWATRYGPVSAKYAERSYADWKAGTKGMSATTLGRWWFSDRNFTLAGPCARLSPPG